MKRVLVTGANGFLGRHLCGALAVRKDFVVVLVRDWLYPFSGSQPSLPDAKVFGSFDQIERAIAEYHVDTVVHLAAQTEVGVAVADPVGTFEANARGTWQVLEACRRQKVRRVVVASSDKAYGDWIVPYTEAQPLVPHGIYATSKAVGDMIAQAYMREYNGMSIAITRCGNLYGPGHVNWSTLIPGTIRSVLKGERPVLRSDGGLKRDFLFVEDAVDGYLRLIDEFTPSIEKIKGPFNFGTGIGSTVMEVVEQILKLMKSELRPDVRVFEATAMEIKDQIVNASKAERVLMWKPKHTLAEGLEKTIVWYRSYLGDDKWMPALFGKSILFGGFVCEKCNETFQAAADPRIEGLIGDLNHVACGGRVVEK